MTIKLGVETRAMEAVAHRAWAEDLTPHMQAALLHHTRPCHGGRTLYGTSVNGGVVNGLRSRGMLVPGGYELTPRGICIWSIGEQLRRGRRR
jgi:hypothetical protein